MTNPQKKDGAIASTDNDADPFANLSELRLSQSFIESAGAKKALTTVPVRKPNPQDWVRVHPGVDYDRAGGSSVERRRRRRHPQDLLRLRAIERRVEFVFG